VHKRALYSRLAPYYDRIYWNKDYEGEAAFLVELFRRSGVTGGTILEVGCGTGSHSRIFVSKGYRVTGVDLSGDVLKVARAKVKAGAEFVRGDMRNLGAVVAGEFDAVVCLFSTISYNLTVADLKRTLKGFYDHVKPGGVIAFDTHFTRGGFLDGYRGEDISDDGRVIVARLSTSKRRGRIGEISFTYLVKDGRKVLTLRDDRHRLGLFEPDEVLAAMRRVGFTETRAYWDWTFSRRIGTAGFKDTVFVGRK
jgi:dTDP-3-amino-3,4,6-trideoxy-alpha-D-glucopyranose N,N-dimethyltransferase